MCTHTPLPAADAFAPAGHVCTARDPWTPARGGPALHPDARELPPDHRWHDRDVVLYACPHCGHRFKVRLPPPGDPGV